MRIAASLSAGVVLLALLTRPALAQSPPGSIERGRALSERLCTNCHNVTARASGPVRADVPSFPIIAGRTGVTAERLAGAIIIPHPAMPGVQLTIAEIRDVVAYILSLKPQQ